MRVRFRLRLLSQVATLLLATLLPARDALADDDGLPLYGRLYLGAAYLKVDPLDSDSDQHGPAFAGQLDLGVRLTSLVGLHIVGLYDASRRMTVDSLSRDDHEAGAFGAGAGADLRLLSFLTSLSLGWQSTQFTTNGDPSSPDGARSGFLLARLGYVLPLPLGLGAGAHLFGKYAWSHDENHGIRYDPKSYTLGGLLSFGFDGSGSLF